MLWTVILGAVVGAALGALLTHFKFGKPLPGFILGACLGLGLSHFAFRGPTAVAAAGTVDEFRTKVLNASDSSLLSSKTLIFT